MTDRVRSGDFRIDSLLSYADNANTDVMSWHTTRSIGSGQLLTYDFPTTKPVDMTEGGFAALTAQEQSAIDEILDGISEFANVRFVRDFGNPDIEFATADLNAEEVGLLGLATQFFTQAGGSANPYQYYTDAIVLVGNVNPELIAPEKGNLTYEIWVHEIGHALGLEHTFDALQLEATFDNTANSVMSYTDGFNGRSYASTMMEYDILTLQYLYGANTDHNDGNTTYDLNAYEGSHTIWDGGGIDTVSLAQVTDLEGPAAVSARSTIAGQSFDHTFKSVNLAGSNLATGGFLAMSDAVSVMDGANIERVVGSAGSDFLVGNGLDNIFVLGRAGDVGQNGLQGVDKVVGGAGTDTLELTGARSDYSDLTSAHANNTAYFEGAQADVAPDAETWIFDDLRSDQVSVTGGGTVAGERILINSIEQITFSDGTYAVENGSLRALGGEEPLQITGTDVADWLTIPAGSGSIDGGAGRDMASFQGLTDHAERTATQYRMVVDLGAGTAEGSNGEAYTLSNIERITGTVNADFLRGGTGAEELRGGGAYDWFVATSGADTYDGGQGNDMVSFLEWTNTQIASASTFDSGAPLSGSAVTGVLVDLENAANNTNLAADNTLISVERVTGSSREDVFWGDGEENDFRGLGGYDWFVGSEGGRERYYGGAGVDTVTYFNATSAVAVSLSNGAVVNGQETGVGTRGAAQRDLFIEMENVVGSEFGDRLAGNAGRNELNGLGGNDVMDGYAGADILKGGTGDDYLDGGEGSDVALFDGMRADYTLTKTAFNRVTVTGADGTDTAVDIEYFRFDDTDVTIWDL